MFFKLQSRVNLLLIFSLSLSSWLNPTQISVSAKGSHRPSGLQNCVWVRKTRKLNLSYTLESFNMPPNDTQNSHFFFFLPLSYLQAWNEMLTQRNVSFVCLEVGVTARTKTKFKFLFFQHPKHFQILGSFKVQ